MSTERRGSKLTRAACGEKRCFYSYRIHEALARAGISAASLAKEIGVTKSAVSNVLAGRSHSPYILNALRNTGVPERYLFDPREESGSEQ